jgi:hypothetical protein
VLSIGAGKGILGVSGSSFERTAQLGYEIGDNLFLRPEVGYYFNPEKPEHSSWWGGAMVGVKAKSTVGPMLHIGVAPVYLANPDNHKLSGNFQFHLEGGIGIESNPFYLGMVWSHHSCAGIKLPNNGLDAILVQLRITSL